MKHQNLEWICLGLANIAEALLTMVSSDAGNAERPPADWRSDRAPPFDGSERALACLRCASPMTYVGRRHFQDGSYAKEVLLGEFFLERVRLDMYRCEGCGKVEFFAASRE